MIRGLPLYAPQSLRPLFGTIPILDWESISFAPNSDITSTSVSSDGMPEVTLLADETGTITINLKPLSPTNHLLWGVVNDMRKGSGELNYADFALTDNAGIIPVYAKNVWVESAPTMEAGQTTESSGNKTWVLRCEALQYSMSELGLSTALLDSFTDRIDGALANFAKLRV